MNILTILLAFVAVIFVFIPMIVMVLPPSKSCTNEEQCSGLRRRLQLTALFLLGVSFICLGLVVFYMYQNSSSTEESDNPQIDKFLTIGLAAIVIFSGFIIPWLTSLSESAAEYSNYPPKDDCPLYWRKSDNTGNSWTCSPIAAFGDSYKNVSSLRVNRSDMESSIKKARDNTIFWDGYYNGGFLT